MTSQPFRIRSEADVLALVPYTFGFHPVDSLVLVTLDDSKRPFQARIDLPDDLDELPAISEHLVVAALRNGAARALVIVYSDDECVGEAAAEALAAALDRFDIPTLLAIRADGSCWFPLGGKGDGVGEPYDVRGHELSSRAVLDGRVTFRDRTELADSLAAGDPVVVESVQDAHDELPELPGGGQELLLESLWLMEQVRSRSAGDADSVATPDPVTVARVLRALRIKDVRDLVWCDITSANAERHVALWRDIVRRSPEGLVAPAAGLLAFSAWLSGDGALAWCAVDRCLCADPDHVLGQLVGDALTSALPPSSWRPIDPESLALFAG
jgi:hypothetical protein